MEVRCLDIFEYAELQHLASQENDNDENDDDDDDDDEEGREGTVLLERFMEALGPSGCGLLAVRGVPSLLSSRRALLPLARFLALLPHHERSKILQVHGLGTDVSFKDPERLVSSFAAQLTFGQEQKGLQVSPRDSASNFSEEKSTANNSVHHLESVTQVQVSPKIGAADASHCQSNCTCAPKDLHQLGFRFRQLGKEVVEVGLLVARVCDIAIPGAKLEEAILEAGTAKGRLVHYHSLADRDYLRAGPSCSGSIASKKKKSQSFKQDSRIEVASCDELWQQWHFDYGVLTVLTAPMFMSMYQTDSNILDTAIMDQTISSVSLDTVEAEAVSGHIGLKVLNVAKSCLEFVRVPADCLVIQVGEAAQILTGGKLQATAHCVCRPPKRCDISRETFVVFLQPAWHKCLFVPEPGVIHGHGSKNDDVRDDFQEIQSKVPVLESRWKNGCTFAEFSRETTKQYYGAKGAQSQK